MLQPSYDLPPSIKALQAGWQTTFQSAATVSALLAAIESQLFVFVKGLNSDSQSESESPNFNFSSALGQALLFFTYLTFFLSIGATVSSLILTDQVGELPIRAYGKRIDANAVIRGSSTQILVHYGLQKRLRCSIGLWVFMLVLGYLSLLVQILIYVWATESVFIRASVVVMAVCILAPFLSFLGSPEPAASEGGSQVATQQPGGGPVAIPQPAPRP